jgi:hypothetical protein
MTGVAGGCIQSCHGRGSAAETTAAHATTPTAATASAAANTLVLVSFGSNFINRTIRLSSITSSSEQLIREGLPEREVGAQPLDQSRDAGVLPRTAVSTYTKAHSGDNRMNPRRTRCGKPPQPLFENAKARHRPRTRLSPVDECDHIGVS